MKTLIFKTLLVLTFGLSIGFISAQEKNAAKRVEKMVEETNAKLAEKGDSYKLTAEQKKILSEIYGRKIEASAKIKAEEKDEAAQKEKMKEINKATAKEINDKVFTAEQKNVWKELKKQK